MKKGIFITFEGPEGSGKSTQSICLCNFLKKRGYPVVHLREPGGTRISEALRKLLLAPKYKEMSAETEALLYLASRAQIVEEKILPALKKGKIVILDRFQDSTLVYQGYGEGIDLSLLEKVGKFVTKNLSPDLTFLLDIETKEGLKRATTGDRIEKKSLTFHRRVRKGYLRLAQKNPEGIVLIKADKDKENIQKVIQEKTLQLLENARNNWSG